MAFYRFDFQRFSAWLALVAALALPCNQAYSEMGGHLGDLPKAEGERPYMRADEFFSEEVAGEVLVSVHLLGAVNRSGVYHVPRNTDLVHLIALAGGTRNDADLKNISIKRRNKAQEQVIQVNLKDIAKEIGKTSPVLEAGDMVLIYTEDPLIDRDTLSALTVASALLSLIVSSLVLINNLHK